MTVAAMECLASAPEAMVYMATPTAMLCLGSPVGILLELLVFSRALLAYTARLILTTIHSMAPAMACEARVQPASECLVAAALVCVVTAIARVVTESWAPTPQAGMLVSSTAK